MIFLIVFKEELDLPLLGGTFYFKVYISETMWDSSTAKAPSVFHGGQIQHLEGTE